MRRDTKRRDHARDLQVQTIRDRLSRLGEASLRINESLELDTVLQGVIDSARSLSGAVYGGICTVDEAGRANTVVASGIKAEELQRLSETPAGLLFYQHALGLTKPLRTDDGTGYFRALGLPEVQSPVPRGAFLVTTIRSQDRLQGIIYLGKGEHDGTFTAEEEETVVSLASQAAIAITNAYRYGDEQKARTDLETLIDTSPVGVILFDVMTRIPSFNRETLRIFNCLRTSGEPEEYLREVVTVHRGDGRVIPLASVSLGEALSIGEVVMAEEVVLRVPDGRSVTVLMNATPVYSKAGAIETYVVTLQDMTPIQEMERLRAEFLGMVSHELRTPLATVRGSVSALMNDPAGMHPVEMHQFYSIILEQTDRMRALINDLLDVARIETGTLSVSPEPADVAVVVDQARKSFYSAVGVRSLQVDLQPGLPWVMADRQRIVQVLTNLLSNAAQHSPQSTTIQLSAVRYDFLVAISVSDEGHGIPAASLPHLFRKFSRAEGGEGEDGTGLGLAVCKGIVEAHGGRIWAESAGTDLGTRFTFTLPTAEEAGYTSPAPPVRVSSGFRRQREAGQQVRILAVDDDVQALRYIRAALAKGGYAVIATSDPNDVARIAAEEKPHLVLLDLMLPGIDGIELMQEIGGPGGVPVIFVTAYGQDHLVSRAFDAGAADYVVKPFSPTELLARIRAVLRGRETPEPSRPYVLRDLVIDYAMRQVRLAGSQVRVTPIQYRTLVELSTNHGRVVTYEHLLERVWGTEGDADMRPMRTVINALRRQLGDDAHNPTYIFTEPRIGYRMPRVDTP